MIYIHVLNRGERVSGALLSISSGGCQECYAETIYHSGLPSYELCRVVIRGHTTRSGEGCYGETIQSLLGANRDRFSNQAGDPGGTHQAPDCGLGGVNSKPIKSSTVNISVNDELLEQIDQVAREVSRSRSELIREVAREAISRRRGVVGALIGHWWQRSAK